MIDLHSHLLPAVDDGSRSVEQSLRVLAAMAARGVTDICLTPHVRASRAELGPPEAHDRAFASLQAVAPGVPSLHRGAEIMLDQPLMVSGDRVRRLTLAGTRYVLVEFPSLATFDTVTRGLQSVRGAGLIPLLAHPERYSCCSVAAVHAWRTQGAYMQVDATTLIGTRSRGIRVRELVAHGLADIMAADNHGDERNIGTGHDALVAQGAADQAALLATHNPGAILRDLPLTPVPPFEFKPSLLRRFRELFVPDGAG